MRLHRGYRLARILKETTTNRAESFRSGGFGECHRIPAGMPLRFDDQRLEDEHVVFEARKSDFEGSLPGSMVSHLFAYRPPRCGFTRFEKMRFQA